MRKAVVLLAAVLLASTPCKLDGQVRLGIFGGTNRTDLSGDAPSGASFLSSSGFAAGIVGEFVIARDIWLSFQPMYVQKGSDIEFGFADAEQPDTLGLALNYITLPVLFKFVSGNGKTYASGGLDLGYLMSSTLSLDDESRDVKDAFNSIDLSADFAFGVMFPIGRPKITVEARYTQSILNLAKQGQNPDPDALPTRFRSSGFQLFAGLLYPLGGRDPRREAQSDLERAVGTVVRSLEFKRPMLGGHAFMPNNFVRDPFIKTFVRNSIGIGNAVDVKLPLVEIGGDTILGLQGDIMYATLDFEYQQAIRPWLAARGEFNLLGRLGTNVGSLLASGLTAATGFEVGWLIRLFHSEKTQLTGTLELANNSFTAVNITRFVEDVINGRPASLVQTTPSMRGGGGIRFAWGVSPFFGLTALAETGYGESVDRSATDEWQATAGATVDFDFLAISSVPIGVLLGGRYNRLPDSGEDTESDIFGGVIRIAYNGRSDFIIGLDIGFERFESRVLNQTLNLGSIGIDLRYYF